jgi:protein arginine kinase activator
MLCEHCHENEATFHVQEVIGSEVKALHLCAECAAATGMTSPANDDHFDLQGFLKNLGKAAHTKVKSRERAEEQAEDQALSCPGCGLTRAEFRESGRCGCPECYEVFSALLAKALLRMHRGTVHRGKKPGVSVSAVSDGDRAELARLREELRQAVSTEAYERAAELRDRIEHLVSTPDAGGPSAAAGT